MHFEYRIHIVHEKNECNMRERKEKNNDSMFCTSQPEGKAGNSMCLMGINKEFCPGITEV